MLVTQNNGRISQKKDWRSGEEVNYQYDTLNRLVRAETTGPQWGLSFSYDGFGNLWAETPTKGSAPQATYLVGSATNRLGGAGLGYDNAGNLTSTPDMTMSYDGENRLAGPFVPEEIGDAGGGGAKLPPATGDSQPPKSTVVGQCVAQCCGSLGANSPEIDHSFSSETDHLFRRVISELGAKRRWLFDCDRD